METLAVISPLLLDQVSVFVDSFQVFFHNRLHAVAVTVSFKHVEIWINHDQRDDDLGTPSEEPKRIRTFQTFCRDATRERTLSDILEPFIRSVVREETEYAIFKRFPSSSSTSVNEAGTSSGCSLQLLFTNKLPNKIFTNNILKAEDGSPLTVILCHADSKTVIESGPLSSARIDIFVLSGLFATDQDDWTEDEFSSKILRQREGKRPLLAGNQSIVLKNGVGIISNVSITDNSSWIPNKKFILGAKFCQKYPGNQRVREAKSNPVSVKDNRGEGYTKHHPPNSHDEVWRLENIRKDGIFHERLNKHGILTVGDFLFYNKVHHSQLRHILGLGRMSEKMWYKIVDHAETCNMHGHTIFKHSNECYRRSVEDLNQPANLKTFDGQPSANLAVSYEQVDPFAALPSGSQQLEPIITHSQEHLQIMAPMRNSNSYEVDGTHTHFQIQNNLTNTAFTSALETSFAAENTFFQYQTPWQFPILATSEQGNDLPLPSSGYAAEVAEFGIFSSVPDHGVNILNGIVD